MSILSDLVSLDLHVVYKFYLCILSTFFSGWGYCIGVSTTCTREFTFDFIEIQGELS